MIKAQSERSCLEDRVHNEVLGRNYDINDAYISTGVYEQARYITWVILNRMALTIYLDHGRRHGNNASVIYCHVSYPDEPCDSTFTSPNQDLRDGIDQALREFYFQPDSTMLNSDPTDGSIEWRHIPNDGWNGYNRNQVFRQSINPETQVLENPEDFWDRHTHAATIYMSTVDANGRNYTSAQVTREDIMLDGRDSDRYRYFYSNLFFLGTLTVFNRHTNNLPGNYYHVLARSSPSGSVFSRDSCSM